MNTKSLSLVAAGVACALLVTTTVVRSQDAETQEAGFDPNALAAMAPGPMHAHLEPLAGDWHVVGKWRTEPGGEWQAFDGLAHREMILGGRQLRETFESEFGGMAFEGEGFIGHDNLRGEYNSVWMDNMSTGTMFSTGTADAAGTTLTFTGEVSDAMSGETHKWFRSTTEIAGPNENTFKTYAKDAAGEEWVTMELVYTRK